MTQDQAESAVTTSALLVGGVYAYRKLTEHVTETPTKKRESASGVATGVIGTGELLPVGQWLTGAGVTFILLAILASASPDVGGWASILVTTGCLLGNGQAVFKDLKGAVNGRQRHTFLDHVEELAEEHPAPTQREGSYSPKPQVTTT